MNHGHLHMSQSTLFGITHVLLIEQYIHMLWTWSSRIFVVESHLFQMYQLRWLDIAYIFETDDCEMYAFMWTQFSQLIIPIYLICQNNLHTIVLTKDYFEIHSDRKHKIKLYTQTQTGTYTQKILVKMYVNNVPSFKKRPTREINYALKKRHW